MTTTHLIKKGVGFSSSFLLKVHSRPLGGKNGFYLCQSTYIFILEEEDFFSIPTYDFYLGSIQAKLTFYSENYTQSRTSKSSTGNPSFALSKWNFKCMGNWGPCFLFFIFLVHLISFTYSSFCFIIPSSSKYSLAYFARQSVGSNIDYSEVMVMMVVMMVSVMNHWISLQLIVYLM